MNTLFKIVHSGKTGTLLIRTCIGMPAKRLLATVHICTRTRGNNIERGICVEYSEYVRGYEHKGYIFNPVVSKNAKDYLRIFDTAEHMEEISPDTLAACAYACKKGSSASDSCFQSLKKHQPGQLEKIFLKKALVFEKALDEEVLAAIIVGFHANGVPIDDPLAKAPGKEESAGWSFIPNMMGIGIKSLPLSI